MPFISIIIPVYNVEPYLRRCLNSVLSQSFEDFELLLVDDGSKDASGTICDEYARRDKRIKVFHKVNGGVSSARNLGLEHAQGEWIYFVDADDEMEEDGLQVLVNGTIHNVDVVLCGYKKFDNEGKCVFENQEEHVEKIITQQECIAASFDYPFYGYYYLGWMCVWMFKHSWIEEIQLRFDANIKIKEDTLFVVQYLCGCVQSCYFNSKSVYRYYETETSIMHSARKKFEPKYVTSFNACVRIKDAIMSLPQTSDIVKSLAYYAIWDRYYIIRNRMTAFSHVDNTLLCSLRKKAIRETGFVFTIKYQYERNKRRICNFIMRKLKA